MCRAIIIIIIIKLKKLIIIIIIINPKKNIKKNNNNNNNLTKAMLMVLSSWQSHCESSPGSFDECRITPSGRLPKTKPDDLLRMAGVQNLGYTSSNLNRSRPFAILVLETRSSSIL